MGLTTSPRSVPLAILNALEGRALSVYGKSEDTAPATPAPREDRRNRQYKVWTIAWLDGVALPGWQGSLEAVSAREQPVHG